ncbi:MAG: MerR family transcriptional regulator [Thiomicrospira sp.]|uniref:MerR family transcriptional regulator n=1 Tax=Thiomicrospira sp. TaxID=935 RepID=UPI001A001097|nr:MerR family transcriptional regulator [Thiomicrospira sp.]MBE0493314.1 MerR family transcriptional regulator [Thiomicrospira sp.]
MNSIDQNALYPIREVSRLTGVKPITLRAWERRYDLIEPVRTESGHRLYTQEHIDFLNQALKLMDEGIPVSRVKAVLSERVVGETKCFGQADPLDQLAILEKAMQAITQLNLVKIHRVLDRLFADYSLTPLLEVLIELDNQLKANQTSTLSIKIWHSALQERLHVRLHHFQVRNHLPSKRIFIQTTSQNQNWIAKLAAVFCFEQGFQPISLDEMIPFEKLQDVIKPLNIYGVILIDKNESSSMQWQVWFEHFASMRTWVMGSADIEDLTPPSINCELRGWPNWLSPLA